jgi:hypothetical protein
LHVYDYGYWHKQPLMPCFLNAADPFSMAPQKALELIGNSLTSQYERWQPKVGMFSLLTSYAYKLFKLFFSWPCCCIYRHAISVNLTQHWKWWKSFVLHVVVLQSRKECCSITMGMVCHIQLLMVKFGSTIRSIFFLFIFQTN